jgi:carbonic anhydrase
MKTLGFCLLILSLSVLHLKAQLHYDSLSTDWTNSLCTDKTIDRSPVALLAEKCEPYETFSIDLPDISATAASFVNAKGSYELAYTGGKMTVNSHVFTTLDILFRVPAEHKLPGISNTDSMEIQIELTKDGTNVAAVLSFIMIDQGTNVGYANSLAMLNVLNDVTTAGATTSTTISPDLKLAALTTVINQKLASDSVYLNLFTYAGTLTYPACDEVLWYVYGSPLIATLDKIGDIQDAIKAQASTNVVLTSTFGNNRDRTGTHGGSGSLAAVRLCYTGYFKNYMNYNYGLWFGVVIIVFWFIINLMLSEKPIKDSEYQENVWTNHPLYSIRHVGNDLFTRKTRMALLLGTLTIHALFTSVWYRRTDDPLRKSNIIVYAVYSMLIDWAFIYIIGSMLRGYYVAKHQYYKTREEAWEQKSQNRIFAFYFSIFLCAVVLWPFCVWNMSELHPEKDDRASNYWVASFFIGLGLEFLIVDPLVCLLAKSITPLRNLMKHRGYFYDNICHETYLDHLKVD